MTQPMCGDRLDQDGWQGRCQLLSGHALPHEGLCVAVERSEVAQLAWSDAMAEHTEMWADEWDELL